MYCSAPTEQQEVTMKVMEPIQDADMLTPGMEFQHALQEYAKNWGLTVRYCEPAIFKAEDGNLYQIVPTAVIKTITPDEVERLYSHSRSPDISRPKA